MSQSSKLFPLANNETNATRHKNLAKYIRKYISNLTDFENDLCQFLSNRSYMANKAPYPQYDKD